MQSKDDSIAKPTLLPLTSDEIYSVVNTGAPKPIKLLLLVARNLYTLFGSNDTVVLLILTEYVSISTQSLSVQPGLVNGQNRLSTLTLSTTAVLVSIVGIVQYSFSVHVSIGAAVRGEGGKGGSKINNNESYYHFISLSYSHSYTRFPSLTLNLLHTYNWNTISDTLLAL